MKKLFKQISAILSSFLLVFSPVGVFAAPVMNTAGVATYDMGDPSGGPYLSVGAIVCKKPDCINVGVETDWKNYSATSATNPDDTGEGDTLVASPGDTLSFLGMSVLEWPDNQEASTNPIFKVLFTNGEYMEDFDPFGNGLDNIDGDGNYYGYDDVSGSIAISDGFGYGLNLGMIPQIGAVTAKLKNDIPDGTIITGTFYIDDPSFIGIGLSPFQKAYAADNYARSTVRIRVSNPVATPGQVLPRTGASFNGSNTVIFGLSALSFMMLIAGVAIARRKSKKA